MKESVEYVNFVLEMEGHKPILFPVIKSKDAIQPAEDKLKEIIQHHLKSVPRFRTRFGNDKAMRFGEFTAERFDCEFYWIRYILEGVVEN